jgi:hypothetical protein
MDAMKVMHPCSLFFVYSPKLVLNWHQIPCLRNLQEKAKLDTCNKEGLVMCATYVYCTENTVSGGQNSPENRVLGKSLHGNRTVHYKKCIGTIHCKKCEMHGNHTL